MNDCFLTLLRAMRSHCFALSLCAALLATTEMADAATPMRVLFVGNSLTNRNDLPEAFRKYLSATRPSLRVDTKMIAPDGATLADHHARGAAEKTIRGEHWDYVVFQEGYDMVPGYSLNGVNVRTAPTRFLEEQAWFSDLARANGAKPVIFEGWGDDQKFPYIDYASVEAARSGHALLAPIGRVWRDVQAQGVDLVSTDNIHPNVTGTWLMAATIAETLFPESAKNIQSAPPAGVTRRNASNIRTAAVREVYRLKTDGMVLPPAPEYATSIPDLQSDGEIGENVVGRWCAQDGGIRLSFGTELDIRRDGQLQVSMKDFSTSALLEPKVTDLRVDERSAAFKVAAGSVHYDVQFAPHKDALQVLTGYDTNKTHRIFRSVAYTRECGQYFDRLHDLYATLSTNEQKVGLAEALKLHYAQLHDLVDEATFTRNRQGFPVSEWDPIMVGMYYSDSGAPARALDYYKAAVDMTPNSVDANFYYGKGLAALWRRADARAAYTRALTLNSGKSQEMASMIEAELAGL